MRIYTTQRGRGDSNTYPIMADDPFQVMFRPVRVIWKIVGRELGVPNLYCAGGAAFKPDPVIGMPAKVILPPFYHILPVQQIASLISVIRMDKMSEDQD